MWLAVAGVILGWIVVYLVALLVGTVIRKLMKLLGITPAPPRCRRYDPVGDEIAALRTLQYQRDQAYAARGVLPPSCGATRGMMLEQTYAAASGNLSQSASNGW